jgi:hypothetical protein
MIFLPLIMRSEAIQASLIRIPESKSQSLNLESSFLQALKRPHVLIQAAVDPEHTNKCPNYTHPYRNAELK